jgi:hypothetical protein
MIGLIRLGDHRFDGGDLGRGTEKFGGRDERIVGLETCLERTEEELWREQVLVTLVRRENALMGRSMLMSMRGRRL